MESDGTEGRYAFFYTDTDSYRIRFKNVHARGPAVAPPAHVLPGDARCCGCGEAFDALAIEHREPNVD